MGYKLETFEINKDAYYKAWVIIKLDKEYSITISKDIAHYFKQELLGLEVYHGQRDKEYECLMLDRHEGYLISISYPLQDGNDLFLTVISLGPDRGFSINCFMRYALKKVLLEACDMYLST